MTAHFEPAQGPDVEKKAGAVESDGRCRMSGYRYRMGPIIPCGCRIFGSQKKYKAAGKIGNVGTGVLKGRLASSQNVTRRQNGKGLVSL
jgi:hypothetical protein